MDQELFNRLEEEDQARYYELEKFFEHPEWLAFVAEIKAIGDNLVRTTIQVDTAEELWERKGQVSALLNILKYESTLMDTFQHKVTAALQAESQQEEYDAPILEIEPVDVSPEDEIIE